MALPYQYIQYATARQALSLRLNDTSQIHWTDAEVGVYLTEALRTWNVLTQSWKQDWTTTYSSASLPWQSTANSLNSLVGSNPTSPRYQTLTDDFVYTVAQYHMFEPPTGGTWTGTPQFTIADFAQALERRTSQVLQATACNVGPFSGTYSVTPNANRVILPDSVAQSVLDLRRIRFIPTQGSPSTLYRDDSLAFEYFEPGYEQSTGPLFAWDFIGGPPLAITFDRAANVPNTLDILAMLSNGNLDPPNPSPLLIPDDYYWVLKFGMMADLMRKESESYDQERADYCEARFQEGVQLMAEMPWLLQARIDNIPVDTPSVAEADTFYCEWQSRPTAPPMIVRGGIDLFAVAPTVTSSSVSVLLSMVGNFPVPVLDADYVQVPRDVLDVILDEAQHLALIKHGGKELKESMNLHQNFIQAAVNNNDRLKESGIFDSTLFPSQSRQSEADPRFAAAPAKGRKEEE